MSIRQTGFDLTNTIAYYANTSPERTEAMFRQTELFSKYKAFWEAESNSSAEGTTEPSQMLDCAIAQTRQTYADHAGAGKARKKSADAASNGKSNEESQSCARFLSENIQEFSHTPLSWFSRNGRADVPQ